MPKVPVYNTSGSSVGEIELSDAIFGIEVNQDVLHEVVVAHLANRRQGTQSTLTRAEVRGGGIKPWRQKGTGRARQGSTRSPQWRHGGIVFAPKPRDYSKSVNKKVRRLALKSALSAKVNENELMVLDALELPEAKTREMCKVLAAFNANKTLIIVGEKNEAVERASQNIPGVQTTLATTLNVYDILKYDKCIATKDAIAKIEEVYA